MTRRPTDGGTRARPPSPVPSPEEAEATGGDRPDEAAARDADVGRLEEGADERDLDAERMLRVRAGDREAFRELYERHFGAIARFAGHFLGHRSRGEEIAQDVFLQLYRARERYEPRARFSTYLYTIAQNLCLNEVRRPEHRAARLDPTPPDGDDRPLDLADETGAVPGGEAVASGRELEARFRALLAELPEAQRAALILSRSHELRYQEIAAILSCSEQAVKSLIFRATRRLKEGLKEYLEEAG